MISHRFKLTRVDGIGAILVAAAAAIAIYFVLVRENTAAEELERMRHAQMDLQTEFSRLQKQVEHNENEYAQLHEQAKDIGALDPQPPIEERLRLIRLHCLKHDILNLQIMPLQWHTAGDVAEQSFTVTGEVTFEKLLAFLDEFQEGDAWADISHLKLAPSSKAGVQLRQLEMVLNFYSNHRDPA